jgi:hypothetical protein
VKNLRFPLVILGLAMAIALGACDPDVLFKIYPGGVVVVDKTITVARGAAVYLGIETAAVRKCAYVEGLEQVQLASAPSQGQFSAAHGASVPFQIAKSLRKDCTLCLPDWRICYQASPDAQGVDNFSFDFISSSGCVIRYNYVVYLF